MMRYIRLYLFVTVLLASVNIQAQENKKPGGLWTVDISSDDKYIALGGDDSLLRVFSSGFDLKQQFELKEEGMLRCVQWHPQKNILAVSTRNTVYILDPIRGHKTTLEGKINGSRAIGWNHNGELLAAAAGSGVIWIWDKHGKLLRKIQKKNEDGTSDKRDFLGMDWHPSKNILVTVGDEIRIFDTSGKQINSFRHRVQQAGLLSVKWHPAGEYFATGDYGHEKEGIPTLLQFWSIDGKLLKEIRESKTEIRNLRWDRSGTKLATASDALRIWSKEGKLLYQSAKIDNLVWGVDWTSDSKNIVTVSFDSEKIQYWNSHAGLLASYY